ncbi:MAG: universal stress protein [Akkermansiaceae bacterium]|nr:universal stress protein [Akkermansiaceae bacterium]
MKPYNVLIPTDFSEASLRAIDAALELRASHPNMKITLLNVVESLAVPGDPIVAYLPVIEHQIKSSQQLLEI